MKRIGLLKNLGILILILMGVFLCLTLPASAADVQIPGLGLDCDENAKYLQEKSDWCFQQYENTGFYNTNAYGWCKALHENQKYCVEKKRIRDEAEIQEHLRRLRSALGPPPVEGLSGPSAMVWTGVPPPPPSDSQYERENTEDAELDRLFEEERDRYWRDLEEKQAPPVEELGEGEGGTGFSGGTGSQGQGEGANITVFMPERGQVASRPSDETAKEGGSGGAAINIQLQPHESELDFGGTGGNI